MKRFNKTNGMYALLVAVVALIGITIYGSCSADEDYDGYSSKDELFTLADSIMGRGVEEQIDIAPYLWLAQGEDSCTIGDICGIGSFSITIKFNWGASKADIAQAVVHVTQIVCEDPDTYKNITCTKAAVVGTGKSDTEYPDSTTIFRYTPLIQFEKKGSNESINNIDFCVNVTNKTHWVHP